MGDAGGHWLAEAVVDFLRGPLYIHPLMAFIDEKCLCFTPDEENKLEYTVIHNEFKELVDGLLTSFVEELGIKPEAFYEMMAAEQSRDKLSAFVVQTILTVDDFLMFKAMMVKRNIDLTNQVLDAVSELRVAHELPDNPASPVFMGDPTQSMKQSSDKELEMAVRMSQADFERDNKVQALQKLMRSLQLQDEDVALAIAIANSLKDMARSQAELAELEQALALSMALEAEQRRLAAEQSAADRKGQLGAAAFAASSPSGSTGAGGSGGDGASSSRAGGREGGAAGGAARANELLARPFPEPKPLDLGPLPALGSSSALRPLKAPTVEPLAPLNIGPNTGADKLSAVAAAAAQAASLVAATASTTSAPEELRLGDEQAAKLGAVVGTSSGRFMPTPLNLEERSGPVPAPAAPKEKFVPQPLNLPDKAPKAAVEVTGLESLGGPGGVFAKQTSMRNRALGYKGNASNAGDIAAIRAAAQQAAATQKSMMAARKDGGEEDAAAQAWLQDAKMKLIAQKKVEREAEMSAYKQAQAQKVATVRSGGAGAPALGGSGSSGGGGEDTEAKRAALRDKLASKFKQDLLGA